LDTSVVIALRDITDAAALLAEPLITTVTLAELSVGPLVARDDKVRAARQAQLQEAERTSTRCLSTGRQRGPSARWRRLCGGLARRPPPVRTMR
jgi:predicted nucleic acid-binding protein